MGYALHIRSDGEGAITYGGKPLLEHAPIPLDDDCQLPLRTFDLSGGHAHAFETWVVVSDDHGSRVAICVDRPGEYVVTRERVFPVGGPDAAFS